MNVSVNYLLDIILLCVFLLFVAVGIRRGFIRSAAHFLGAAISAFLAAMLGGAAAQWVFDTLFRPSLIERISQSVSNIGNGDVGIAVESYLSSMPDFIVRALEGAGVTAATISGDIAAQSGQVSARIADALAPVFVGFLKVLAVIVLFLLFMMLVRLLAEVLSTAFRLPVLSQVNGLLGGIFGFLLALISVWVVVSAVQVFTPMLSTDNQMEIEEALEHSIICGAFVDMNPLGEMFR